MTTINPISNIDDKSNLRSIINQTIRQVSDVSGSITVTTSGTITIQNPKIFSGTVVVLSPRNAAASSATYYVSSVSEGSASVVVSGTGVFDYQLCGVR